tara:strand:+ start:370 stop:612 length:243 start_codon:yes stop_codon:yes gene_type:complete
VAEQVTVDEEELKELQRPWHAAHVDVGLVKKPLERRLGAWTKDALLRAIACGTQGCRLDAWGFYLPESMGSVLAKRWWIL